MFSWRNVPWFTPNLRSLVLTKKRKYSKCKNNPYSRNFTEYKIYCKSVKNKINLCRINFEKLQFLRKITMSDFFPQYKQQNGMLSACSITLEQLLLTQSLYSHSIVLSLQKIMVFFPDCLQRIPIDTLCNIVRSDRGIINAICPAQTEFILKSSIVYIPIQQNPQTGSSIYH